MACIVIVPREFRPSMMVDYEDLPAVFRTVVEENKESQDRAALAAAIQSATHARKLAQASGDQITLAIVSLQLGDLYREAQLLGPALEHARRAERILSERSERRYRHNRATATYLLALLHQELGSCTDALRRYQDTLELLEDAHQHWVSTDQEERARLCNRITAWVGQLCRCLTGAGARSGDGGSELYLPVEEEDHYVIARARIGGYVLAPEAAVERRYFRSHWPDGGPMDAEDMRVDCSSEYRILSIPRDGWAGPDSEKGDYLIFELDERADQEGLAVLEEDSGWMYGEFVRENGEVRFHALSPVYLSEEGTRQASSLTPKDQAVGYVKALLKPV